MELLKTDKAIEEDRVLPFLVRCCPQIYASFVANYFFRYGKLC
jgi:hypothetical protein